MCAKFAVFTKACNRQTRYLCNFYIQIFHFSSVTSSSRKRWRLGARCDVSVACRVEVDESERQQLEAMVAGGRRAIRRVKTRTDSAGGVRRQLQQMGMQHRPQPWLGTVPLRLFSRTRHTVRPASQRGLRPPAQRHGKWRGTRAARPPGCGGRAVRKLPLQQLLGHAAVEIVPQCLPLIPILPVAPEQVPASD